MLDVSSIIARSKEDTFLQEDLNSFVESIGELLYNDANLEKAAVLENKLKTISGFKVLTEAQKNQRGVLQSLAKANLQQSLFQMKDVLNSVPGLGEIAPSQRCLFYGMDSSEEEEQRKQEMIRVLREGSVGERHELFLYTLDRLAQFPMEEYRGLSDEEKLRTLPQYFPMLQLGQEGEELLAQFEQMNCGITEEEREQFTALCSQIKAEAQKLNEHLDVVINPYYPHLDLEQVSVKDQSKLNNAITELNLPDGDNLSAYHNSINARNASKNADFFSEIMQEFAAAPGMADHTGSITLVPCDKKGNRLEGDRQTARDRERLKAGETIYYRNLADTDDPPRVVAFKDMTGSGTPTRIPKEVPKPNGLVMLFNKLNRLFGGNGLNSVNKYVEYQSQLNAIRQEAQNKPRAAAFTNTADAARRRTQQVLEPENLRPEQLRGLESALEEQMESGTESPSAVTMAPDVNEAQMGQRPVNVPSVARQDTVLNVQRSSADGDEEPDEPNSQAEDAVSSVDSPMTSANKSSPQKPVAPIEPPKDPDTVMAEDIALRFARNQTLSLDQALFYARNLNKIKDTIGMVSQDISEAVPKNSAEAELQQRMLQRLSERTQRIDRRLSRQPVENRSDEEIIQEHVGNEVSRNTYSGTKYPDEYEAWAKAHPDRMANIMPRFIDNYRSLPITPDKAEKHNQGINRMYAAQQRYQTLYNRNRFRAAASNPNSSEASASRLVSQFARGEAPHLDQLVFYRRNAGMVTFAIDAAIDEIRDGKPENYNFTQDELTQLKNLNKYRAAAANIPNNAGVNQSDEQVFLDQVKYEVGEAIYRGQKLPDEYKKWCSANADVMKLYLTKFADQVWARQGDDPNREAGLKRITVAISNLGGIVKQAYDYVREEDTAVAGNMIITEADSWAAEHRELVQRIREVEREKAEEATFQFDKELNRFRMYDISEAKEFIFKMSQENPELTSDEQEWIAERPMLMRLAAAHQFENALSPKYPLVKDAGALMERVQNIQKNWDKIMDSDVEPISLNYILKISDRKLRIESLVAQEEVGKSPLPHDQAIGSRQVNGLLTKWKRGAEDALKTLEDQAKGDFNGTGREKEDCIAKVFQYLYAESVAQKYGFKAPFFVVTRGNPKNLTALEKSIRDSEVVKVMSNRRPDEFLSDIHIADIKHRFLRNLTSELEGPISELAKQLPSKTEEKARDTKPAEKADNTKKTGEKAMVPGKA